ncbi:hypothetical protein INR49_006907 [Caranx melampygus]|nr:hypothetical protein INR49_006907 [Caranx melampygus]
MKRSPGQSQCVDTSLWSLSPTVQSDRRSVGRPRSVTSAATWTSGSASWRTLTLKSCRPEVCLQRLRHPERYQTGSSEGPVERSLFAPVFQTYPMRELRCPCGLQEADFLDLLRSTFPQLAANEPFDIFWSDRSRLLKPLKVKALTPEEISSTIKSTGAGKSPLYIRLKTMSVSPTSPPSAADSPHNYVHLRICILKNPKINVILPRTLSVPTKSHPSAANSSHNHVTLRICILDNPKINVILPRAFKKWPVQELKCPRGLQEADFLDLLRSTFPQLEGNKPFDVFTIDRNRTLKPLRVEALTPEKIGKTIKSRGKSALYIRLKPFDKEMKPIILHKEKMLLLKTLTAN